MNWDIIQGKWKQVKGSLKEQWGDLTDDDLDRMDGSKDQLAGKLQEKYGWTSLLLSMAGSLYLTDAVTRDSVLAKFDSAHSTCST